MNALCTFFVHMVNMNYEKPSEINVRAYLKYTLHFVWGLGQEGAAGEGHHGGQGDHQQHDGIGNSIKPAQKMLLSLQGMNSFKASDISNI